jgi:hypothetical protein
MMRKSLLALAFAACALAPLASANAATIFLSTSAGSPTPLAYGDIGTVAGITAPGYLDSSGNAKFYFDFSSPGTATSFLGNLDFIGFASETATVSLVGLASISSITAPTVGSLTTGAFSAFAGPEYELAVTGTPGAAFVANVSQVAASVPEPGAWALMLAGFGGMGLMLRNTRRKSVAAATA